MLSLSPYARELLVRRVSKGTDPGGKPPIGQLISTASRGAGGARTVAVARSPPRLVNPIEQFPEDVRKTDKVALLLRMDDAARSS